MATKKKYFWLKLKDDFFNQKEIKMLRRIAGGDTHTIIYLKMLLLSIKNDGKIYYDGIANNMVEEIALEIDEEVENVSITFNYLQSKGLIVFNSDDEVELSNIHSMIGSESASASRVRKHRARKALHCNNEVTDVKRLSNTEIEKELDIDIEIDKEKDKEKENRASSKLDGQTYEQAFEIVWSIYPKKKGKAKAFEAFKKAIKNGISVDDIKTGIANYNKEIAVKHTSEKFIKHGSTWFNGQCWKDDYETEPVGGGLYYGSESSTDNERPF